MANGPLQVPGMQVNGQQLEPEQEARRQGLEDMRQMQNRQQGVLAMQRQPPGVQPGGFSGPGGANRLNEIYGIMAQGADQPAAVGQQYVQSMQKQQVLDRANQPIEQFLKLYGNVNPYDWSAQSLQRFHDNYVRTGQLQFDLLEPKQTLTAEENKAILTADERMYKAGSQIGRVGSIVDRLDQRARTGDYKQGILGSADEWISQNITGNVDDTNLLKQEYRGLKNSAVIADLPPGVASDKDIAIAREGWPGPNVNPAYLAAFMRGMQKMQVMEYAWNQHRSHYIGMNRNVERITEDWQKNKGRWISDAMYNNGLKMYNPMNEDGTEMDMNQAAEFFYRRQAVGGQPDLVRTGAPTAAVPTRRVPSGGAAQPDYSNMSEDDLMREVGGGGTGGGF